LTSVVLTAHAWNSRSALCAKGGRSMSHERFHCGSCSSTFAIKQKRGNGRTTTILGIPHRKASRFTKRARRSAHQLSQSSKNEVNDGPRLTVQDPTWKAFIEVHKKKRDRRRPSHPSSPGHQEIHITTKKIQTSTETVRRRAAFET
jgi:hypothetical protein